MVERAITFAVESFCNYRVEVRSEPNNEINLSVEEDEPQCFLALRLTRHDGIANTVQELGLMGIKSVHNGSGPSSLNYKTLEELYRHIDNERETVGTCDEVLATEVRR